MSGAAAGSSAGPALRARPGPSGAGSCKSTGERRGAAARGGGRGCGDPGSGRGRALRAAGGLGGGCGQQPPRESVPGWSRPAR